MMSNSYNNICQRALSFLVPYLLCLPLSTAYPMNGSVCPTTYPTLKTRSGSYLHLLSLLAGKHAFPTVPIAGMSGAFTPSLVFYGWSARLENQKEEQGGFLNFFTGSSFVFGTWSLSSWTEITKAAKCDAKVFLSEWKSEGCRWRNERAAWTFRLFYWLLISCRRLVLWQGRRSWIPCLGLILLSFFLSQLRHLFRLTRSLYSNFYLLEARPLSKSIWEHLLIRLSPSLCRYHSCSTSIRGLNRALWGGKISPMSFTKGSISNFDL